MSEPILVVHGGAGSLRERTLSDPEVQDRVQRLDAVCGEVHERLTDGLDSLSAVELAVSALEDVDGFNAGRGAALCSDGSAELSASIMSGRDRACGAVALIRRTRNPVSLARFVMEHSPHVFMAGADADSLAESGELPQVPPEYFVTDAQRTRLQPAELATSDQDGGTVGAVALDQNGDIAAATSTGGLSGQSPGRISDSAMIGAGTYADNSACAVSCTGAGEEFIRLSLAADLAFNSRDGEPLPRASAASISRLVELGGRGGFIALNHRGEISMEFNTEIMFRSWRSPQSSGASVAPR